MAWIKSYQNVMTHPKLVKLSGLLGCSRYEAIGILHSIWWWALEHAETGYLTQYDSSTIEECVGYREWCNDRMYDQNRDWSTPKDSLIDILKESGWVDIDGRIHNWLTYAKDYLYSKYHTSDIEKYNRIIGQDTPKTTGQPKVDLRTDLRHDLGHSKEPLDKIRLDKIRLNKDIHIQQHFDKCWSLYPRKLGKTAAYRHYRATVKTDSDREDIEKALTSYIQRLTVEKAERRFVKHGSTWFNQWRDEMQSLMDAETEAASQKADMERREREFEAQMKAAERKQRESEAVSVEVPHVI